MVHHISFSQKQLLEGVPVSEEIVDDIIRAGRAHADEVEVALLESESVSIELKQSHPAHAGESHGTGLIIRVIHEGKIGSSSTSTLTNWRNCLDSAIASAHLAEPIPWRGLPGPVPIEGPSLSFDSSVRPDPDVALTYCKELLAGATEFPEAAVVGGGAGLSRGSVLLANSAGIRYVEEHTSVSASLEAIADHSTGFEYDRSVSADIDACAIGRRAAELAATSRNGLPIETGTYDLLLSPHAFASLCAPLLKQAVNGRSVLMGRSFLADKLGTQIAPEHLMVVDDPFYPGGLGSTRFDAEGVPTRKNTIIDSGYLNTFIYDLKTGYRCGHESTGNASRGGLGGGVSIGMHNLVVTGETMKEPGEGRCVLVNEVIGAHTANPLTGDFSVEIQNAFFMEDGHIQEPIRKAMLAGNIFGMLEGIVGMGTEPRRVGDTIVSSVRVHAMHLVG